MSVTLPVSIGEAIDKFTILDIKLNKITDSRCNDILKEYNTLKPVLDPYVKKCGYLYDQMKHVNLLIWDMMDVLRDGSLSGEEYSNLCRECIEYNDIRFRVKKRINHKCNSNLREQKSYKILSVLLVLGNRPVTDHVKRAITVMMLINDHVTVQTTLGELGDLEDFEDLEVVSQCPKRKYKCTYVLVNEDIDIVDTLGIRREINRILPNV